MIEIQDVSKRHGDRWAVRELSCTVRPGRVTGFLGPNGSGKSSTLRMVVGLDSPTSGRVLVEGRRYAEHPAPLTRVGALLEARGVHPGRSARAHLQALAATHRFSRRRVEEVLELVGLTEVAHRRSGGFSLGMGQRLGIAAALLGDPATVLLDEPANGLDPDGVRWLRGLLRQLADEGRTVLVSSHLLAEMAGTADHVVVLGRGRLLADAPLAELLASGARPAVRVRSPRARELRDLLHGPGVVLGSPAEDVLLVEGASAEQVGEVARAHGVPVHELVTEQPSLEEAFAALTGDAVEFDAGRVRR
ncbi:ATP-binding cassette domain-containing protein [uncultured Modestobacter sp.]|uniref:ATP-binding cassette domain-containing protein n=1 Tax=uncultured Modestobacter sp. TaxID=380048 RepID=UPI00262FABA5|nr:ATP-binding cassette domain-containing protein [uncultured Modestobacter sp.]